MSIRRRDQTEMGPNNDLRDKRSAILNLSANSQTLVAVIVEPDSPADLARRTLVVVVLVVFRGLGRGQRFGTALDSPLLSRGSTLTALHRQKGIHVSQMMCANQRKPRRVTHLSVDRGDQATVVVGTQALRASSDGNVVVVSVGPGLLRSTRVTLVNLGLTTVVFVETSVQAKVGTSQPDGGLVAPDNVPRSIVVGSRGTGLFVTREGDEFGIVLGGSFNDETLANVKKKRLSLRVVTCNILHNRHLRCQESRGKRELQR